jgi:hypothetical protein
MIEGEVGQGQKKPPGGAGDVDFCGAFHRLNGPHGKTTPPARVEEL